jgi:surface protein
MFYGCENLRNLDLTSFNFDKNVIRDMSQMFNGCSNLTSITFPDDIDTSNVTDMSSMFKGCEKFKSLDLRGFTTSNVTTFASMFEKMKAVTEIKLDYTKFTAADKLTSVDSMFSECEKLQKIDLRGFSDCPNLTTINKWFYNCWWMEYIDLSNFSTGTASDTKLNNIRSAFTNLGNHMSGGTAINDICCKIFAKCKWNTTSNCSTNSDMDNCFRINLYGSKFKNAQNNNIPVNGGGYMQGDPKHLDVVYYEDYLIGIANGSSNGTFIYNGKTNSNQSRLLGPYFNSAYIKDATEFTSEYYSDYYKSFFTGKEGYSFDSTNAPQSAPRRLNANAPLRVSATPNYATAPKGFTGMRTASEVKEV